MAGPAGISAVLVGPQGWSTIASHPAPPRRSVLSLLDWKEGWVDTDRTSIPVIAAPLELRALSAAVGRLAVEGMPSVIARHRAAAAASRAGLCRLGLVPWVPDPADTAAVATTLRRPAQCPPADGGRLAAAGVSDAPGELATQALRINHTGRRARLAAVLDALDALVAWSPLGAGSTRPAREAATRAWEIAGAGG
jgi:aspartate aminotransferase-like enzyme